MSWTWKRVGLVSFVVTVLAALAVGAVFLHRFVTTAKTPRVLDPPSPLRALSDRRLVSVTVTTPSWQKVRWVVTVDTLRTDHRLWRQMHFNDWDAIPAELREPAVLAMVASYRPLFAGPAVWRDMRVTDWDQIPQPIRAMVFLRMIWYWARHEELGVEFGLSPTRLATTVASIVMAESWFEHRAINVNQWGNRDLGLAQCSDFCRAGLAQLAADGEISFTLSEADYFDPWIATRVATVWFERELLNAGGDVDLAIRAYHRGIVNAMDEKGDAYHARVVRLREDYIRSQDVSPTWQLLTRVIKPL